MKNIHILPTENSSRLSIKDGVLILHRQQWRNGTQNIYITSDEEIKEGDWFLDDNNSIGQSYKLSHVQFANPKKIILTTDFGKQPRVQAIDDEFLEWLVKNPTCEEVKFKDIKDTDGKVVSYRFISALIPKEEPTSCACGANTSCQCEEPKEKTFEEILSKMTLVNPKHLRMTSNGHGEFPDGYMLTEDGVKYIVKQLKNK